MDRIWQSCAGALGLLLLLAGCAPAYLGETATGPGSPSPFHAPSPLPEEKAGTTNAPYPGGNDRATPPASPSPAPGSLDLAACCAASEYRTITPAETQALLAADPSIQLVDVRTEAEYEQGHIPGACSIPLAEIDYDTIAERLPDLGVDIIVYCRTGVRSSQASAKLREAGYLYVYDLGGIVDWPYKTISGSEERLK